MKRFMFETKNTVKRFATVLATMVAGFAFAFVGSAVAAPVDKVEMEKQEVEKIEKQEVKSDSKAFFDRDRLNNRNFFFDRDRVFDRRPFFNDDFRRPFFFNRFDFDNFDKDDDD